MGGKNKPMWNPSDSRTALASFTSRDGWQTQATMPNKHKTSCWDEGLGCQTLGKQSRSTGAKLSKIWNADRRETVTTSHHSLKISCSSGLYLVLLRILLRLHRQSSDDSHPLSSLPYCHHSLATNCTQV